MAPAGFFGFKGVVPHDVAGEIVDTTVGRVLFYGIVPDDLPFSLVNRPLNKKALGELVDRCYRVCGAKRTVLRSRHRATCRTRRGDFCHGGRRRRGGGRRFP